MDQYSSMISDMVASYNNIKATMPPNSEICLYKITIDPADMKKRNINKEIITDKLDKLNCKIVSENSSNDIEIAIVYNGTTIPHILSTNLSGKIGKNKTLLFAQYNDVKLSLKQILFEEQFRPFQIRENVDIELEPNDSLLLCLMPNLQHHPNSTDNTAGISYVNLRVCGKIDTARIVIMGILLLVSLIAFIIFVYSMIKNSKVKMGMRRGPMFKMCGL